MSVEGVILCKVCLYIRKSILHRGKWVCPMCGVPRPGQ